MIDTCKAADVKLMVAYRIQYEAYNLRLAELARSKTFGRLVGMSAINVQTVAEDGWKQWRHKKAMAGGGSLFDIGLYCLNTARFVTGEEPVEIMATQYSPPSDERYAEVEETISFMLRFPSSAIVNCFASYGARDDKHQRLNFGTATVDMPNAYQYVGQSMTVTQRNGDDTGETRLVLTANKQFATEIDHMADCIIENKNRGCLEKKDTRTCCCWRRSIRQPAAESRSSSRPRPSWMLSEVRLAPYSFSAIGQSFT
jgi:predicted dehydrogenase